MEARKGQRKTFLYVTGANQKSMKFSKSSTYFSRTSYFLYVTGANQKSMKFSRSRCYFLPKMIKMVHDDATPFEILYNLIRQHFSRWHSPFKFLESAVTVAVLFRRPDGRKYMESNAYRTVKIITLQVLGRLETSDCNQ